ncbi:putative IS200/IS605-family transposase [Octadecabacter antarcticus 307]|uniref:Putative IS200/IS605-family transposase n=1 Tax=Octadecabacter antarcticus 307 TaxID=391626 RepID=M9RAT3_9RHOB|nr:putative IS200/IS605-family transposase [Octadecabacter antarcticus 307]
MTPQFTFHPMEISHLLSTGSHTIFYHRYHRYHVVLATKYRHKVLRGPMREQIRDIIRQSCAEMGVHILRGVLAGDHVHMFISVPPQIALSKVMQRIKWRSSRRVRWSSQSCANAIGEGGFGPVDISRQRQEMSPTMSSCSIWNYIPITMLPASIGSSSLKRVFGSSVFFHYAACWL